MSEWRTVRWTQARQVARLLDEDAVAPADGVPPSTWFASLQGDGRLEEAAEFLGAALPRFESVAWAARAVTAMRGEALTPGDSRAAQAVRAWIDTPDDERRRAAHAASATAGGSSPERLLGLAVFMSGGSIAPADLDAVNPQPDICGRMAAAAVIAAAHTTVDPAAALTQALAAGETLARGG